MFIDRLSQEWKDADQFEKDSRRSHSAFSKDESARLSREIETNFYIEMYRELDKIPQHTYNPHRYFKGSVFDFIRLMRSKSDCACCMRLFKPTETPEAIYEKYQQTKNIVRKTHYHQYD